MVARWSSQTGLVKESWMAADVTMMMGVTRIVDGEKD